MSRLTRFLRSFRAAGMLQGDDCLLPLQRPGFPVAICWSAKSGCTTVLKWFLVHNGLMEEAVAHSGWIQDYRQARLFASPGYRAECQRLFGSRHRSTGIIKVIRDPASRAVSSYLHFLRYGHDVANWPSAAGVSRWKEAVGLGEQRGLSFRQFLLCVTALRLDGAVLDPHFRQQYDPQQDPCVDLYIRLEDLAAGLRTVEEQFGLPHVDVRGLSVSTHHNPATADHRWPDVAAVFPADHDSLEGLGTPPVRLFLDAETRLMVRTTYAIDYEAYGDMMQPAVASGAVRVPVCGGEGGVTTSAVGGRVSSSWATAAAVGGGGRFPGGSPGSGHPAKRGSAFQPRMVRWAPAAT